MALESTDGWRGGALDGPGEGDCDGMLPSLHVREGVGGRQKHETNGLCNEKQSATWHVPCLIGAGARYTEWPAIETSLIAGTKSLAVQCCGTKRAFLSFVPCQAR